MGLITALVLAVFAGVAAYFGGDTRSGQALAAAFVVAGGLVAPFIFWKMQPLAGSKLGSALVGASVLLPVGVAIVFAIPGAFPTPGEKIFGVLGGVLLGGLIGGVDI